jgi:hypothetical protein
MNDQAQEPFLLHSLQSWHVFSLEKWSVYEEDYPILTFEILIQDDSICDFLCFVWVRQECNYNRFFIKLQ